jgi:hypothetical protein
MREHARRIFVYELDIRHERCPDMEPFEQIVRQERVLGH